jgi:hypothetical protein
MPSLAAPVGFAALVPTLSYTPPDSDAASANNDLITMNYSDSVCGYDEDGEENDDNLGPYLNRTGYPDYAPEPGQQPYSKHGRQYWF